ncbi:MAG: hypothetical protein KGL39_14980 [Patescibacteria group bacterium]|nr:hypothetical protein [Patescibacteria group bacterium]
MAKLDKDTVKVLEKQKKRKEWVDSEGYADFKKILMMKVIESTSLLRLTNLPGFTNEQLISEYGARKLLGQMLIQTLQEIEGDSENYNQNLKMMNETEEEALYAVFPQRSQESE